MKTEADRSVSLSGTTLGCLAALLLIGSAGFILIFALAWSGAHCQPAPDCQKEVERNYLADFLLLFSIAGLLGLIVRFLVIFVLRKLTEKPLLAMAISVIGTLLLAWLAFHVVMETLLAWKAANHP